MAKRRAKSSGADWENNLSTVLALGMYQGDASNTDCGERSFVTLGIEMPLVFQYFLDASNLPLGLIYQITGTKGSRKTSLAFEMLRWAHNRKGAGEYICTESKFSDHLVRSICGYPGEPNYHHVNVVMTESMNEWQIKAAAKLVKAKKWVEEGVNFKNEKTSHQPKLSPGGHGPYVLIVDSVVAQLTEKQIQAALKEGGKERDYATHVKSLSEWVKSVSSLVMNQPTIGLLINHCTVEQADMYSQKIVKEKGGTTLGYYTSLVIVCELSSARTEILSDPRFVPSSTINTVKLSLNKSSIGMDSRKIKVDVHSKKENVEGGKTRTRTEFLWGSALVRLIMQHCYKVNASDMVTNLDKKFDTDKARQQYRERIFDQFPIRPVPRRKNLYYCAKYSDSELGENELGNYLSNDPEFVELFHQLFGVQEYSRWEADVTYKDLSRKLELLREEEAIKFELARAEGKVTNEQAVDAG